MNNESRFPIRLPEKTWTIFFLWLLLRVVWASIVYAAVALGRVPDAREFGFSVYEFALVNDLQAGPVAASWLSGWLRWDTGFFIKMAMAGYTAGDGTTAFGFLYPGMIRLLAQSVGGGNFLGTALAISSVFALAAMILFYQVARKETGSEEISFKALIWFICFPTGFYMFAAYPESIFFTLVFAGWLFARRGRWLLAGLLSGLAVFVRFQGVTLSILLGVLWLVEKEPDVLQGGFSRSAKAFVQNFGVLRKRVRPDLDLLFCAFPVLFYGVFYWGMTNQFSADALGAYDAYWQNPIVAPWTAIEFLFIRLANGHFILADYLNIFVFLLFLVLLVVGAKSLHPALYTYSLVTFFVAAWLSLGRLTVMPESGQILTSVSRYVLSLFPLFYVLAGQIRRTAVFGMLTGISLGIQAVFLFLFVHWVFIA